MTPEQFYQLDRNAQSEVTMNGTFLADREENGLMVQLFSVGDLYVERFYDPLANRILRFRAFKELGLLSPYLAHIRFNAKDPL